MSKFKPHVGLRFNHRHLKEEGLWLRCRVQEIEAGWVYYRPIPSGPLRACRVETFHQHAAEYTVPPKRGHRKKKKVPWVPLRNWPGLKVGERIKVAYDDGFYRGVIKRIQGTTLTVLYDDGDYDDEVDAMDDTIHVLASSDGARE